MRKERQFRRVSIRDVRGSSFAGYLKASYKDLVDRFGKPHDRTQEGSWRSGDQKVRCEWAFVVGSGKRRLVFTIYDYKEARTVESVDLWHVGTKGDTKWLDRIFTEKNSRELLSIKQSHPQKS
jgi:hypothetical protein